MNEIKINSIVDFIQISISIGFDIISILGSHIKLSRVTPDGKRQNITVPNRQFLDNETLKSLVRMIGEYLSDDEISKF